MLINTVTSASVQLQLTNRELLDFPASGQDWSHESYFTHFNWSCFVVLKWTETLSINLTTWPTKRTKIFSLSSLSLIAGTLKSVALDNHQTWQTGSRRIFQVGSRVKRIREEWDNHMGRRHPQAGQVRQPGMEWQQTLVSPRNRNCCWDMKICTHGET